MDVNTEEKQQVTNEQVEDQKKNEGDEEGGVDVNENLDEGDDNDPAQESPLAGKRVHKISGGQNSEGSRTSSTSSW